MTVSDETSGPHETPDDGSVTNTGDLPRPLPWPARYGGAPWLDGAIEEQATRLQSLLTGIEEADGYVERFIEWPDKGSSTPIKKPVRKLARSGILEKQGRDRVALTAPAKRWITTGDPVDLLALLHANIRFLGEILDALSSRKGMTHDELGQVARDDYGLTWKTLDPVRKRVGWLRSIGMVTFEFDRNIKLTESGAAALAVLTVTAPGDAVWTESTDEKLDISAPSATPEVQALVDSLTPSSLLNRKATLGYIPRLPSGDVVDSIRALVSACVPEITKDHFHDFCARTFGIKESSATSTLYTLRSIGLLQQVSVDGFAATEAAIAWLDSDDDVDLVRIVHTHIAYVAELIEVTDHANRSPAIVDYMRQMYGADLDVAGVRARLHLLLGAGLVEQSGWAQYRPTKLGRVVAPDLPMVAPAEEHEPSEAPREPAQGQGLGEALAAELLEAATDSSNSERLERAVSDALSYLGFHAEHLGGPGKTDVLVTLLTAAGGAERRIIVDTKATSSGVVTEQLVNFDALREHQAMHKAQKAALVGPTFDGRINKWAEEHGVALIDAAFLGEVLRHEDRTPVGPTVLARMFDPEGSAVRAIREAWANEQHRTELLRAVFEALANEAKEPDEVTEGALEPKNLYFLLRAETDPKPKTEDIQVALSMLSSPYLRAVKTSGQLYAATEPASVLAKRFRVLARVFQGIADREA